MVFDFKDMFGIKPTVSVPSVRLKQGQSIDLTARDVSGGVIPELLEQERTYGINYSWYTDCSSSGLRGSTSLANFTFIATTVGTCYGAIITKEETAAICNSGCHEAYAISRRAITPFVIEVLPADYVEPPAPGPVMNMAIERLWGQNVLAVSWQPPENSEIYADIAYTIKDSDGSILGITRATTVQITDLPADAPNPVVIVSTISENGSSEPVSSEGAKDISGSQPVAPDNTPSPSDQSNSALPLGGNDSGSPIRQTQSPAALFIGSQIAEVSVLGESTLRRNPTTIKNVMKLAADIKNTNDNNLMLWTLALVSSILIAFLGLLFRKKRKKDLHYIA